MGGLGWVHKLMGWVRLGEEKWTHVHLWVTDSAAGSKGVRRILVRGVNAPLTPEANKILKSDHEMVHSEVHLNKYVVSSHSENCSFFASFAF